MIKFRNIPIRTKLISIQVLIAFILILFSSAFFVYNDINLIRSYKTTNLISITRVMGMNSASALLFGDKQAAENTLSYFSVQNDILNASIIDKNGKELASYTKKGESKFIFSNTIKKDTTILDNTLLIYSPIKQDNNVIGTICIRSELSELNQIIRRVIFIAGIVILIGLIIAFFLSSFLQKSISGPILQLYDIMKRVIATEDYSLRIPKKLEGKDEVGTLAATSNSLMDQIQKALNNADRELSERRKIEQQINHQNWKLNGVSELNDIMRGEKPALDLAKDIIDKLSTFLNVQIGAIYFENNNSCLKYMSGYAIDPKIRNVYKEIKFGDGLVGQAALSKKSILIKDVPENYFKITSGIGEASPKEIILSPFLLDRQVKGVIELGSNLPVTEDQKEFLDFVSENIAIAVNSVQEREQMKELLDKTKAQAEDLELKQEELKTSNEELTEQRNKSQLSEEELRVKHEELEETNNELQEKTQQLEEQNEEIKTKNADLENLREALTIKAEELTITSKYKSEFLANMSHELRTPLNSVMILAKLLSGNKDGNLTPKQVESANIILKSGNDLLALINDILDLTKIESGKMSFEAIDINLSEIESDVLSTFNQLAKEKDISFKVKIDKNISTIHSDKIRLMQIIRNLLSNSFKFTPGGGEIEFSIYQAPKNIQFKLEGLKSENKIIAFSIKDTGIGIPSDKQQIIFEAFQQADTSTSRKYGGTGLGLTISKEMVDAMGGEIHLHSEPDKGSTFTVFLPEKISEFRPKENSLYKGVSELKSEIPDDKKLIAPNDKIILIIENDLSLAELIKEFAHSRNFKTLVANDGDSGLAMAMQYKPNAIIMDSELPVIDADSLLAKLKDNNELKNIPVHVVSTIKKNKLENELQNVEYLRKPINKKDIDIAFDKIEKELKKDVKTVLIIEDNPIQNDAIRDLLQESGINSISALTGTKGIEILKKANVDCIILDLRLPDISGFELIEKVKKNPKWEHIPFIINTMANLTLEEENKLKKYAGALILKTPKSKERLMEEVTLFLYQLDKTMDQGFGKKLFSIDKHLSGKSVLIVDDDMRNIYALMNVLEEQGLITITANDGEEALKALEKNSQINIVLMDMMMPNVDGYEATRRIRAMDKYKNLPIIALTAKAMMGDREKCIEAGASDYISKPVDVERLLSLMRVWLYK